VSSKLSSTPPLLHLHASQQSQQNCWLSQLLTPFPQRRMTLNPDNCLPFQIIFSLLQFLTISMRHCFSASRDGLERDLRKSIWSYWDLSRGLTASTCWLIVKIRIFSALLYNDKTETIKIDRMRWNSKLRVLDNKDVFLNYCSLVFCLWSNCSDLIDIKSQKITHTTIEAKWLNNGMIANKWNISDCSFISKMSLFLKVRWKVFIFSDSWHVLQL
jgi:hypothetical protein